MPSATDPNVASSVVVGLPSGEELELQADAVVMGVGVAPATEFLRNSKGFEQLVDRTGAIAVDEFLRVKGLDGSVYAIGDIASYPQPGTGESRRIEHWNVSSLLGIVFVRSY